jgi:hypothetical protein
VQQSAGFEAGTPSQYLTYALPAAGFEVSVTLSAMRNKTDRNDARGLAQIPRTGWYSRVHVESLHSHQVRALLASRKAIRGSALRADTAALPVRRGRQLGTHLQSGRRRCSLRTLRRSPLAPDPQCQWSTLKAWGVRLAKTRGHRRAVIAVARSWQ